MTIEFKAGERIYCPKVSLSVLTLYANGLNDAYPLSVKGEFGHRSFTTKGFGSVCDKSKMIFHATDESKIVLDELFDIQLERLTGGLSGSDLTRHLLSMGRPVLCYVGATDILARRRFWFTLIASYDGLFFTDIFGGTFECAVPYENGEFLTGDDYVV